MFVTPSRFAVSALALLLTNGGVDAVPRSGPSTDQYSPGKTIPAAGVLLVARRDLPDPNFHQTVVLIVRHDDAGTLGLIVNRRGMLKLADAVPDIKGAKGKSHLLYFGGPVARGQIVLLVQSQQATKGLEHVMDNVYFGIERSVLEALLASNKSMRELRLYAGHSGWAPGQLNYEIARGDWHLLPARTEDVFSSAEDRLWPEMIERAAPVRFEVRRPISGREPMLAREHEPGVQDGP